MFARRLFLLKGALPNNSVLPIQRIKTNSLFHTSSFTRDGGHVSPIKAFTDSIKKQMEENKDFQQNAKLIGEKSSVVIESEAVKKAKKVTSAGAEAVYKTASAVGGAIGEGFSKVADSTVVKATGSAVISTAKAVETVASIAAEPIKKTEVYKNVASNVGAYVQEVGGRYGGYTPKEQRRTSRVLSQMNRAKTFSEYQRTRAVKANPEAGEGLVMHKDSKWKESWTNFKENSSLMQNIFRAQKSIEESENPVIEAGRAVKDRIRGVFGYFINETESAHALRQIRDQIDPTFRLDAFLRDCREYIIPEIMDAYLQQDSVTLKLWCSEAAYNVLNAIMTAQINQGVASDCKILDLRNVDFHSAKVLDNDIPVIIITFQTQENNVFRDKISGEIVAGKEDLIEMCHYVSIFTKVQENADDPITGGWKMIDLAKQSARPTW
ncbi:Mitochondrial import inner membrane translocase subunit tim44 [Smittium mucronatum]|uniref:Mitochondrial import inner membrane translocase subunit TIM44 n=1 Tax=Smittium mucronatum TaxID=133383 RepID=A0A1R0H431_9FUNG|nr:Mitochondrial import inner membrane translocase subunit tim44 [Smittium mucronatum]